MAAHSASCCFWDEWLECSVLTDVHDMFDYLFDDWLNYLNNHHHYGVPKAKKIFMPFDFHYTYTVEIICQEQICTLLNFNCTLLDVNYMLSNNNCTLLKVDYTFDVNCKLSCEYFMLLNSYYTFLVRQNYIWSVDLKIETLF